MQRILSGSVLLALGLVFGLEQSSPQVPQSNPEKKVIGVWSDTRGTTEKPNWDSRITIYSHSGRVFMEQTFKPIKGQNQTPLTQEMIEKQVGGRRAFEKKSGSTSGDHFVITKDGSLEIRDRDGLVSTAKAVKPDKAN